MVMKELSILFLFFRKADLCLCLGTSLQIIPCGNMPLLTKRNGGKIVIVNLQSTKQDKQAHLKIHCYINQVMRQVCQALNVSIPHWEKPIVRLQSLDTAKKQRQPKIIVDETLQDDKKMIKTCDPVNVNKTKESNGQIKGEMGTSIKLENEKRNENTGNTEKKNKIDKRKKEDESEVLDGIPVKSEDENSTMDCLGVNLDRCNERSVCDDTTPGKSLSQQETGNLNHALSDSGVDKSQEENLSQTKRLKVEVY